MRKILIGLMFAGVAAAIAVGARNSLLKRPAPAADVASSEASPSAPAVRAPGDDLGGPPTETDVEVGAEGADSPAQARAGDAASPAPELAASPAAAAEPTPKPGAEDSPVDAAPGGAETVLKQTAAAYAKVHAMQAEFVQRLENPLLGSTTTSRGALYERQPDRFLMRFSDPKGDVVVSDGTYLWVYYPSVDPAQVIRTRGAAGAMDLQAQFVGDPLERFSAKLLRSEAVDARAAKVLELTPRGAAGYKLLRVWVDDRDHLIRRFDIEEQAGPVRHFQLRNLKVNPSLPDSLFHFEPPADATVIDRG